MSLTLSRSGLRTRTSTRPQSVASWSRPRNRVARSRPSATVNSTGFTEMVANGFDADPSQLASPLMYSEPLKLPVSSSTSAAWK